ncbi:hypothetical protein HDU96_002276 [Phlyctochytrium bullatum]|nr:hypothetical protein HDU96_002276 [Phlyctochytrium bullatum]
MKDEDTLPHQIKKKLNAGDTALAQFIGFFLRKVRIEEEHAHLCNRLASESAGNANTSGIERLWAPFLDSCRKDAAHRMAMAQQIRTHVIAKLETFKTRRNTELEALLNEINNLDIAASQALSKSRDEVSKLKTMYREKGMKLNQLNQTKESSLPKSLKLQKELSVSEAEYRQAVWKREEERLKFADKRYQAIQRLANMEYHRHAVILESVNIYADLERQYAEESSRVALDYRESIGKVDVDQERNNYVSCLEETWQNYPPIFYYHISEGDSKDLVFGVPLDVHLKATQRPIPQVLEKCIHAIEKRGLKKEGIYRISAKHSDIMDLRQKLEKDINKVSLDDETWDVHVICGIVKMFLRELPKPLLEIPDIERKEFPQKSAEDRIRSIQFFLKNEHKATLKFLVDHLAVVAQHSEDNKMTAQNLAVVFGPPILTNTQKDKDLVSDGPRTKAQQFLEKLPTYFSDSQKSSSASATASSLSPSNSATELGLNLELAKNDSIIEEMIRDRNIIFPPEKIEKSEKSRKEKKSRSAAEFPSRFDSLPANGTTPIAIAPIPVAGGRQMSLTDAVNPSQVVSPLASVPHAVQQTAPIGNPTSGLAAPQVVSYHAPVAMSVPPAIPVSLVSSQIQPGLSQQFPLPAAPNSPIAQYTSGLASLDSPPPPPPFPVGNGSGIAMSDPKLSDTNKPPSPQDPLIAQAWTPQTPLPAPSTHATAPYIPANPPMGSSVAYRSPPQYSFLAPAFTPPQGPPPTALSSSPVTTSLGMPSSSNLSADVQSSSPGQASHS